MNNTMNNTMNCVVITHKNGIKANKALNGLASKVEKLYKNSKNINPRFEMGYDGEWEYIVENTKTDKAMVLKQHPKIRNKQIVFVYMKAFSSQHSEDILYDVENKDLVLFTQKIIPHLCK